MLRVLNENEMEMVSGGCPIDLQDSGLSAELAQEFCRELELTAGGDYQTPSSPEPIFVNEEEGSGSRIPRRPDEDDSIVPELA